MLRVTVDTNVIISGLNFGGDPRRILQMAQDGTLRMAVSDFILDEVARVLRRDKFGWPQDEIRQAVSQIEKCSVHVYPKERLDVIRDDATHNQIVECASASGFDFLISGDKHLLALGRFKKIRIVNPRLFLETLVPPRHGG